MPRAPDPAKEELTARVNALVDSYFKPTFVKPPPPPSLRINYVVDVCAKWRGRYLYLCAKYQAPPRDAAAPAPAFETEFARLRVIGQGQVGLAFARPSGAWVEAFSPISLEECCQVLQEDSHFDFL